MSNDQPPPYEAEPGAYKTPQGYGGAHPPAGQNQTQYEQSAYPAGQQSYAGGAQPHPPSTQPYPPGTQIYPPGVQAYPPGVHAYPTGFQQYPQGAQPYPQYPVTVQQPSLGVTLTGAPTMTTTVVNTTMVTMLPVPCGPAPTEVVCPGCHARVLTSTSYQTGLLTWIVFAVLFFLGFWLCCFIPFCVNDCKDVIHHCPSCRTFVGKYVRM